MARPFAANTGSPAHRKTARRAVYDAAERARRDATPWTTVQAVLAPLQFAVFLVSLGLVVASLATGTLQDAAIASVLIKTAVLYTIMVTGALWENAVFGRYLFAPSFFWEDAVSFAVIAFHTAYVAMVAFGIGSVTAQFWVALAAYALYVVNAAQFLLKMRLARRELAAGAAA